MVKKLLGLPFRLVKKVFGGKKPAATTPPAPRPAPKPRPKVEVEGGGGGHAHSHDHGGGHDHGHAHGGAPEHVEPKPTPEPVQDHGHSHDHGGKPAAKPPKAAAPEAEVGTHIRVDVSETPNPNARKFTCSVTVIEKGSLSFNAPDEAATHPLGKYVWAIGGVKGIFAVKDFVTVTKTTEADWNDLSPKIIPAIRKGLVERGT